MYWVVTRCCYAVHLIMFISFNLCCYHYHIQSLITLRIFIVTILSRSFPTAVEFSVCCNTLCPLCLSVYLSLSLLVSICLSVCLSVSRQNLFVLWWFLH